MRVAVVLPGHVRTFERCWPTWLEHVVKPNGWKCRYFIHTYDLAEMTQETSRKLDTFVRPPEAESRALVERALETLRPFTESCVVDTDPPRDLDDTIRRLKGCGVYQGHDGNAVAQCYQAKKLQMAYEPLRHRLGEFDLIVRSRFDMEFLSDVVVPPLGDRSIATIDRKHMPKDTMCDCFAAMPPDQEICDRYFDVFDTLLSRAEKKAYMRNYTLEHHFGLNARESNFDRIILPNPDNTIKCIRFGDS